MTRHFHELLAQLNDQSEVDATYLHGLLTASATIDTPDMDELDMEIAAQSNLDDLIIETLSEFSELMLVGQFRAELLSWISTSPVNWLSGYMKSVEIHGSQWERSRTEHPYAKNTLEQLQGLAIRITTNTFDGNIKPYTSTTSPTRIAELSESLFQYIHKEEAEDWDFHYDDDSITNHDSGASIDEIKTTQSVASNSEETNNNRDKKPETGQTKIASDVKKPIENEISQSKPEDPDPGFPELVERAPIKTTPTIVRAQPKVGRNDPCPCGSGKKFKKCCMQ